MSIKAKTFKKSEKNNRHLLTCYKTYKKRRTKNILISRFIIWQYNKYCNAFSIRKNCYPPFSKENKKKDKMK